MSGHLFSRQARDERGQSFVQVLIAIALMGILMGAFATMMTTQTRESKALLEKLAALDFQQQLTRSFADGSLCTKLLKSASFDSTHATPHSTNPPSITLDRASLPINDTPQAPLLATQGKAPSSLTASLVVASGRPFQITNIRGTSSGGVGNFTGNLVVNFDQSRLIRSIRPAETLISFQTASFGTTEVITSCETTSSFSAKCTTRQVSGETVAVAYCNPDEKFVAGTNGCGTSWGHMANVKGMPVANGWKTECWIAQGKGTATATAHCCK